ncbi:glycosyltransferase, partial [Hydrogenibacillus schlegelii]|uniref:glycosyltransferase n=1 Tax=Hydrogenibacillus schlegelii TaxID=1484 RepID=UPI003F635892
MKGAIQPEFDPDIRKGALGPHAESGPDRGGTAGHVMLNLALIPHLRARGIDVAYIGSRDGLERRLLAAA